MREYVIITDSCADFSAEMVEKMEVMVRPLSFTIDGETYMNWPDGRDLSSTDFYKKLRDGGRSSTSQVNTMEFVEMFRPVVESGNDILYLGFSSGLSGTVNSGFVAAEEVMKESPECRINVVDTLAASLGQGLLIWYAVKMKNEGKSLEEVTAWVEENKLNLAHWFTVDDLMFLRRGGRISGTAALLGTMIGIKPVLHVDNEGHLINVEKTRGRKKSLLALVDHMETAAVDPASQTVFISHGDCLEDAEFVADEVRKRFGVGEFYINHVGPVIGSHSGPGTVALFFIAKER